MNGTGDGKGGKGGPYEYTDLYICQIPMPPGWYSTVKIIGPEVMATRFMISKDAQAAQDLEDFINTAYRAGLLSNEQITQRYMRLNENLCNTLRMVREELVFGGDWATAKSKIDEVLRK